MRTYRIRPTSVAELEDDDVVIGHDGKPVLWRDHPERLVMRNESSWHYPKVVAERIDWHENAFSKRECFPKYRIVQGTAPEGATDVFYKSYDSDRITQYAVLEEGDDD